MRYPALPKKVSAPGGPVFVRLVTREKADDGAAAWGTYDTEHRVIRIERGLKPAMKWRIFWHEYTHVCLDDSGVDEVLTKEGTEAVCQAIRTGLMALGAFPPR